MTDDAFRDLALALDGAVEDARTWATPTSAPTAASSPACDADDRIGMVKLTPEQQAEFLREHPAMFTPSAGAWGRQGCTNVVLRRRSRAGRPQRRCCSPTRR